MQLKPLEASLTYCYGFSKSPHHIVKRLASVRGFSMSLLIKKVSEAALTSSCFNPVTCCTWCTASSTTYLMTNPLEGMLLSCTKPHLLPVNNTWRWAFTPSPHHHPNMCRPQTQSSTIKRLYKLYKIKSLTKQDSLPPWRIPCAFHASLQENGVQPRSFPPSIDVRIT